MTLSYKELQAALKELREQGLTSIKLNSKQSVLECELSRINEQLQRDSARLTDSVSKLSKDNSNYPFCDNTVSVTNDKAVPTPNGQCYQVQALPAMNSKYAPDWLCKPQKVYVIDGIDYLPFELDQQLMGAVCDLPAAVNECKLLANQPPRLQEPILAKRKSNARPATPIVNSAKDKPKAKLTYSKEPASPYFIDINHHRFTEGLGTTERQAARNLQDAIRVSVGLVKGGAGNATSATKRGLAAVIDIAKGFHKANVERALKAA